MYRCKKCEYEGKKLIFQFTDYNYCIASNESGPEFINNPPKWVADKAVGDMEIGEPIGCPKCHSWGENNFEII